MSTLVSEQLIATYKTIHFKVLSLSPFTLIAGKKSSEILTVMADFDAKSAAFLTAWNPESVVLNQALNKDAQSRMEKLLNSDYQLVSGIGVDPDETWPGEPSVIAIGISRSGAEEVGKMSNQNAFVWIGLDGIPELILLR